MGSFKEYLIKSLKENRLPPRKMDYQFDEVDPNVDKNSFRDANKDRRAREQAENDDWESEREHHRRVAQYAYDRRWGNTEEEEQREQPQKAPATRDRMSGFGREIGKHLRVKSKKRAKQQLNRFARRQTGEDHPNYQEEEEQRMAPRGMDYKFDKRRPGKGATRHQSLPTGKSARSNRVVNNSLYRPKTKDEFVKDKAASAFKEGDVGGILAAAFRMIKENDIEASKSSLGLIKNDDVSSNRREFLNSRLQGTEYPDPLSESESDYWLDVLDNPDVYGYTGNNREIAEQVINAIVENRKFEATGESSDDYPDIEDLSPEEQDTIYSSFD